MYTDSESSEVESESEDPMSLYNEWTERVRGLIHSQHEDTAIRYLDLFNINEMISDLLPDDYVRFMTIAISQNCMRVFDCIFQKYIVALQTRVGIRAEEDSVHRQNCMHNCLTKALDTTQNENVLASTLDHVLNTNISPLTVEIWQNVFATLFKLSDIEVSPSRSELVLSKLKILLEHGFDPVFQNPDRQNYSAFHEFTIWCVHTNATTDTIDTGFKLITTAIQQRFDINKFFTMDIIKIIFQSALHASVPRVELQCFSTERTRTILRILQYYENYLTFWFTECNPFFSVTNLAIMIYLFTKGVNPKQKNENGQTAITSLLYQVTQDCILFEHTQDQADELYSCIFQLFVYKVGLDEESLAIASALIRPLASHRPVFEKLNLLLAKIVKKRAEKRT
jgi:hypothetical protein